jgi:hypothetical protein
MRLESPEVILRLVLDLFINILFSIHFLQTPLEDML